MDRSFDFILAGAALIVGIMLLTGHGDIFLKGGNTKLRKEKYDEKKMTWGSGVALILIGIATFIDSYTTALAAKIGYIIVLLAILAGLVLYLKFKCARK
ncbi:DUF3784 domain-containing protein [Blautia sp. MSJ-19]|uniref:DUF3784 domain-containing protein n=1 Tax=Blautia sp. MSJ-19 TaxID=2841517 RepID=UPI001C0F1533|nr:DUF3784 domain-containing protein [Blautia sp. MSJ-19]MBU5480050.1 DUF3784 domain-containing protein [Blautia sp. MSJ-19]